MRKVFLFFLMLGALRSQAQLGISGSYNQWHTPDWLTIVEQYTTTNQTVDGFYRNGSKLSVDYWFRLKNVRIEFHPEVGLSQVKADWTDIPGLPYLLQSRTIHFQWNTNIYLFDFFGDCDCPTFSKSEPFLKKGFFVQISPGINLQQHQVFENGIDEAIQSADNTAYSLAAGIGLDIGVARFLTITPYVKGWYYFNTDWQDFRDIAPFKVDVPDGERQGPAPTDHYWLEAGLRLGIRWRQ
ncbi:MAG: hypothetical protein KDC44_20335 [Phaeodactylibacter sp.]|nr:hypothetical protein [Phaeodactylibacter sp.]